MDVNIEHALTVEGWMAPSELETLATLARGRRVIVEIGSWMGRSACAMAANSSGTIICVDAWRGHPQGGFEATSETLDKFIENTSRYLNIIPIVAESRKMVDIFHRAQRFCVDMVFIDACHEFESVMGDIRTWWTLLEFGGVCCGHDYGDPNWPGVQKAVDEFFKPQYLIEVYDSIWMVRK